MLEQIFGSRTRVKVLNLFLNNPKSKFFVREITRRIDEYLNSVRRELKNLETCGILISELDKKEKKKFFKLNPKFFLLEDLKKLFKKSYIFLEKQLVEEIEKTGEIFLVILTGKFTEVPTDTDILIVGEKIDKEKLEKVLEKFSFLLAMEIRYTLFQKDEFLYRIQVTDKFLDQILNYNNIKVINKLKV